jgi:carbohydrate kinase (thermoresistant glucokinase family)
MVWIIMGVSGSGKSTIGDMLATELNLPFYDADDYHPPENVEKMSAGHPLTDEDRKPWLNILACKIEEWNSNKGAVLACSALKESYRQLLISKSKNVEFIYLKGNRKIISDRLKSREDHYMPPDLLDSQFDALEEPEKTLTVSIDGSPTKIVNTILNHISSGKH